MSNFLKSKFINKKKIILDGGTGQTLIEKGLKTKGTLWSTTALLYKEFHNLVLETHLDFINAGSEMIVTNNFSSRKRRLKKKKRIDQFEYIHKIAGKIAEKAKKKAKKKVLIAGSLPSQGDTYQSKFFDSEKVIFQNFFQTAKILNPYVDLFYLDVFCSVKECEIACEAIKIFNKPVLVGLYFSNKKKELPSGETIFKVANSLKKFNCCGLVGSCISPETFLNIIPEFKKTGLPYGFKINAFKKIPKNFNIANKKSKDPMKAIGIRKDITSDKFKKFAFNCFKKGATILGGCCEIKPIHIKELKNF